MRFVFPNALAEDEAAVPIEIACKQAGEKRLTHSEIDKFDPPSIVAAFGRVFHRPIPIDSLKYVSVSIKEKIETWKGSSAQLAIFLSLASLLRASVSLPPGLQDDEVIWATGAVADSKSGSIGIHEIRALKEKLLAFSAASGPLAGRFFLLPARDWEGMAERPDTPTKSLREFVDYVHNPENRSQTERFLVVLEKTDLEPLGRLFAGDIEAARKVLLRTALSPKANLPGIAYRAYPNLRSDAYGALIERFHSEYVGTDEEIPFGGRSAELADLDTWLNDLNGSPFRLLTAEAGTGKSALIARWVTSLATREDLSIVYVPISQRFGTSDAGDYLRSFALQLAHVRGRQIQEQQNTSILSWETEIARLLTDDAVVGAHQVLVVIDGIDEGVGGTNWRAMLPKTPARGIRLCLSARHHSGRDDAQAWMSELGLSPSHTSVATLSGLSREAIVDILCHSASRTKLLAQDAEFVDAFCEVTERQPLVVRLLLAQLADLAIADITTARLRTMKRGITGVVAREVESEVRTSLGENGQQDTIRIVLGILASAVDSVSDDVLFDLARLANVTITRAELAMALTKLRRLLRSNDAGIGFCHPLLLSTLRETTNSDMRLLSDTEIREWDGRFASWGKESLAQVARGGATTQDLPLYVIRHHATHLARVKAPSDDWLMFLHPSVFLAHRERLYHLRGFCSDVERVLAVLAAEDDERQKIGQDPLRLMEQLRCGLLLSAAREDANAVTPGLLQAAVATGYWSVTRARARALDHPNSGSRAACLIATAAAIHGTAEAESCAELLQAAEFALSHERDTFVRLLVERLLVEQSSDLFAQLALDRLAETRAELFRDVRECFLHRAPVGPDNRIDWRVMLDKIHRQLVDPVPPFERRAYHSYDSWWFGRNDHVPFEYWADRGSLSGDRVRELRNSAESLATAHIRARALLALADASGSSQTREELENEALALLSPDGRVAWPDRELVVRVLTNSSLELIPGRVKWLRMLRGWKVRYRVLKSWLEREQESTIECVLDDVLAIPSLQARAHLLVLFARHHAVLPELVAAPLLQTLNEGIAHRSNLPRDFVQTIASVLFLPVCAALSVLVVVVGVRVSPLLGAGLGVALVVGLIWSALDDPPPDVVRTLRRASRLLSADQADMLARRHFPRFRGSFFNRHLAADVLVALAQRVSPELVSEYFALITKSFHVKERQVLDAVAPRLSRRQVESAIRNYARSVDRLPSMMETRERLNPVPSPDEPMIRTMGLVIALMPLLILTELIKNHALSLRGLIGLVVGGGLAVAFRRPVTWTYVRFLASRRAEQDWQFAERLLEWGKRHPFIAWLPIRWMSHIIAEERAFDLWRALVSDREYGRPFVDAIAAARRIPDSRLDDALRLLTVSPVREIWPSLVELAPRFAHRLPVDRLEDALEYRWTRESEHRWTGESDGRDTTVSDVVDFVVRVLGELDDAGFERLCQWSRDRLSTRQFSKMISSPEAQRLSSRRRLLLWRSVLREFARLDIHEAVPCVAYIAKLLSKWNVTDSDAKVDHEVRSVEQLLSSESTRVSFARASWGS